MKCLPGEEPHNARSLAPHVSPNAFKAEVASIVRELGNRLDKLLDQHEACVLRASRNGDHRDLGVESMQVHKGSAQLRPDTVSEMAPVAVDSPFRPGCMKATPQPPDVEPAQLHGSSAPPASHAAFPMTPMSGESAFLPGCPEAPPQPPEVEAAQMPRSLSNIEDSFHGYHAANPSGQPLQRESLHSGASKDSRSEIAPRTIWSEHTGAQQEAVAKYEASIAFEAVDQFARGSNRRSRKSGKVLYLGQKGKPQLPKANTMSLKSRPSPVKCKPTCAIMHPVGQARTVWNLLSLVLICQDSLTVPLLVFDIGDSGPWQVFAWFCTLFWTADVFMAFRTGYFVGVKVEMRPVSIAKQYAMTWFPFDLFIVVFEWFSRFYSSLAPPEVARTTRIVRIVRLLKLLRIAKMKGLVNEFSERLNSNTLALIFNLLLLTAFLCVIAHFVACMWYWIGQSRSDGWTSYDLYAVEQGFDQFGFAYWYVSSARWVICQINGRTDIDERRNMPERGFAVLAGIILSVVGRSVFVALITKMMLQLSDLYKKKEERRRSVNDYLSLYPIPATIERSVKEAVQTYKDIDVERQREGMVLALLPRQLQSDLLREVRKPLLVNHPLFQIVMQGGFSQAARHLCFDVIKQLHAASQERIFKSGDPCSRMFIMDTGNMLYGQAQSEHKLSASLHIDSNSEEEKVNHKGRSSFDMFEGAAVVTRVTLGMCVSEPALWATWSSKGSLITEDNCRMLEVDAMLLGPALQEHTDLFGLTVVYARSFLKFLAKERHLSDLLSFDVHEVELDPDWRVDMFGPK